MDTELKAQRDLEDKVRHVVVTKLLLLELKTVKVHLKTAGLDPLPGFPLEMNFRRQQSLLEAPPYRKIIVSSGMSSSSYLKGAWAVVLFCGRNTLHSAHTPKELKTIKVCKENRGVVQEFFR